MNNRIGFLLVGLLLIAAVVTAVLTAMPSRAMTAEVVGFTLTGLQGPGGEYASGEHGISVVIQNTGDVEFVGDVSFNINITESGSGDVVMDMNASKIIYLALGASNGFSIASVVLDEGLYNLRLTGTLEGVPSSFEGEVKVEDVIDLSIMNELFVEEGHYDLGTALTPTCTVLYSGNVEDWKDELDVQLVIEQISVDPFVVKYDQTMIIMTNMSSPIDPGDSFSVMFNTAWVPNAPGEHRAKFMLDHDDMNLSNNMDQVFFVVDEPPAIEGWVTTDEMDPILDVQVILADATTEVGTTVTDASGYYSFYDLATASYNLTFSKLWLSTVTVNTEYISPDALVVNATLNKLAVGGLRGTVTLPNGTEAVGAQIVIDIPGQAPLVAATGSSGAYSLELVPAVTIDVTATFTGYVEAAVTDFVVIEQQWNTLDLAMGEVPFTVSFDPPAGEPGFPVTGDITLTFSRPVLTSSVNSSTIYLMENDTGLVTDVIYSFDQGNTKVILTPLSALEYGTEYMVYVTVEVKDVNMEPFPLQATSNLLTEVQLVEIFLSQFYPADNADKMPITVKVWARFPEPMNPDTINTTTFKVYAQGSSVPITGIVTYAPGNYTATFTPASNLAYNTRYSVVLDDSVQPISSQRYFTGKTWTFQTKQLVTTGTVSGYIYDEDGKPFAPAKVKVTFTKGAQTVVGTYNAQGKFESPALDAGVWTMKVKVDGYKTYTKEVTVAAEKVTTVPAYEMQKEEKGTDLTLVFIIIIAVIVIIVVIIILALVLSKKEEPEDTRRGPVFGTRARGEPYGGGYQPEYIEGEFLCPQCGNVVVSDDPACPNCGAEFENDLFECPECGGMLSPDAQECPDCGAKFEEELPEGEDGELPDEVEPEPDISREYQVEEMDESDIPLGVPEGPVN